MEDKSQTQRKILKAAKGLFEHYGFQKTTMAEIARECNMSAANIYRFYDSKSDIVAELASARFRQIETSLETISRQRSKTPAEKLFAITRETLKSTHELVAQPKMKEIVDFISSERFDLVRQHESAKQQIIADVLNEGQGAGHFNKHDVFATANAILHATVLFSCPMLVEMHTYAELKHLANEIVELIIHGIGKKI